MPIKVRRATPEDVDWMVIQLKAFDRFYGSARPFIEDEEFARNSLSGFIAHHLCLIACKLDERMGLIIGLVIPHPFNPHRTILNEICWWVDEQYRNTRAGLLLLDTYTAWAGELRVDYATMCLMDKSPVHDRVLLKRGYQPRERTFIMEVN